jgi:hypothetical protein
MEVENAPEVPESEGRLFVLSAPLSGRDAFSAENRVLEWCIVKKMVT